MQYTHQHNNGHINVTFMQITQHCLTSEVSFLFIGNNDLLKCHPFFLQYTSTIEILQDMHVLNIEMHLHPQS